MLEPKKLLSDVKTKLFDGWRRTYMIRASLQSWSSCWTKKTLTLRKNHVGNIKIPKILRKKPTNALGDWLMLPTWSIKKSHPAFIQRTQTNSYHNVLRITCSRTRNKSQRKPLSRTFFSSVCVNSSQRNGKKIHKPRELTHTGAKHLTAKNCLVRTQRGSKNWAIARHRGLYSVKRIQKNWSDIFEQKLELRPNHIIATVLMEHISNVYSESELRKGRHLDTIIQWYVVSGVANMSIDGP